MNSGTRSRICAANKHTRRSVNKHDYRCMRLDHATNNWVPRLQLGDMTLSEANVLKAESETSAIPSNTTYQRFGQRND